MAQTAQSLRHDVYETLKSEILNCSLPPNSDLREQSLAQRFVVSKSPVREALLCLERERLVTAIPRQGYRVAPISIEDAGEMFGLRKVLEVACAEAAAVSASDECLASLDAFRALRGLGAEASNDIVIAYNRAFHSAVCNASGNKRMARVAIDLIEQMERMVRYSVNTIAAPASGVLLEEHGKIIDALQQRDRRAATRLIREHISQAERRVIDSLSHAAIHV
jgi:GntR family transcriptional regulator, rspAB operon transcriptional repressor